MATSSLGYYEVSYEDGDVLSSLWDAPSVPGTALGSALLYRAMKDMQRVKYIIIDVDAQHPASLACCFGRAAGVHNRHMDAIGRYIAASNTFEPNRRPRKGETTRWCLRLKSAPERFPGRLPRGEWPRTANEGDVSASMLPEDHAGEEKVETQVQEEEEVVAPPQPKRGRGRQPKSAQHKKKAPKKAPKK